MKVEKGDIMRKDSVFKNLLENKEYVADLINHFMFRGKKKIRAEDLDEINPVLTSLDKMESKSERIVDMMYAIKNEKDVVRIVGIENQSTVDQDMILRILKSDALAYEAQMRKKERNEIDHVVRVSSMVMYWEEGRWNAPRSLNAYLKKEGGDEEGPDYYYELISPREISDEEIEAMDTPIKTVLECIRNSKDTNKLKESLKKPIYKSVPKDCASAIEVVTDIKVIKEEDKEGEDIDMCLAVEEWRKELREEGRVEGSVDTTLKNVKNLMYTVNCDLEKAIELLRLDEEMTKKVRKLIH